MNIRIARNGTEIARVQSIEMLRHVVAGRSVMIDDHAYVEGDTDWILVSELLAKHPETDGRLVETGAPEKSLPRSSVVDLSEVVRPASAPSSSGKTSPKRHSAYVLPALFAGFAVLMVPLVWFLKDEPVGLRIPKGSSAAVKQAAAYIEEANTLYAKATESWNDDEEVIKQALRRYENAWKVLHGSSEYPEGELISEGPDIALLRDDLQDKIKLCRKQTDWFPWPW